MYFIFFMRKKYVMIVVMKHGLFGGLVGAIIAVSIVLFNIPQKPISTLIVPHHDLVAEQRSEVFAAVAKRQQPKQIILISPNHYNLGNAEFQTRSSDFTTKFGTIEVDANLHRAAIVSGAVDTPSTYTSEHGIITILPDIKHYFPDTTITTIIIKQNADANKTTNLLRNLRDTCTDCMLVASVDFSHYQPYQLSELHDSLTIRSLQSFDIDSVRDRAEIGAPHIAAAAMEWAKMNGTRHFVKFNHTNSTALTKDYYTEGTTHVFGWYEPGAIASPESSVSFTFAGDMMFDRYIRNRFSPDYTKILTQLGDRVLWGTDAVVANLEGPITTIPSLPKPDDTPSFRFDPTSLDVLTMLHLNNVLVDNNHTYDSGSPGYSNTLEHLTSASIQPLSSDSGPNIIRGKDQNIVLYGLDVTAGDTLDSKTIQKAAANKQNNVVVFVHWGPEYEKTVSAYQRQLAHQWIDAGAKLIIGTGPHVVQPAEIYNGRPVFYSLGNFIFDFQGHTDLSQNLVISGAFTKNTIEIIPLLLTSDHFQPILQRSEKTDDHLLSGELSALSPFLKQRQGGLLISIPKN